MRRGLGWKRRQKTLTPFVISPILKRGGMPRRLRRLIMDGTPQLPLRFDHRELLASLEVQEVGQLPPVPPVWSPSSAGAAEEELSVHFGQKNQTQQIWSIGGGKGGVGKSLVTASLAIALARHGKRVIAIDLDWGGANLHTALGADLPKQTLGDFLSHRKTDLNDCVVPTSIPRLSIVSGAQDALNIPQLIGAQKVALFKGIRSLGADYILFDLGAGTGVNTIDFFLFSDVRFIVTLPEPTSIENSYRFIKSAYFRKLYCSTSLRELRPLIQLAMDPKNSMGLKSPADLFREANRISPEFVSKMKTQVDQLKMKLIMNQSRTPADTEIGFSMKMICKKYFELDLDYTGALDYDSAIWQSVRRKRPVMVEFPHCKLVAMIDQWVTSLVNTG